MNTQQIKEKFIPIPKEGYAKIMLLGTTGAGKTTLLRQLIGTDPKKEKFPSTSPSRTTIHDIEIITGDFEKYEAVVTFLPFEEIKILTSECIKDAITAYISSQKEEEMMRRFLEHKDSRFRLSYLLGKITEPKEEEEEDLFGEVESDDRETSYSQSDEIQAKLKLYKKELIQIATATLNYVSDYLNIDIAEATKEERETVIEQIEYTLSEEETEVGFNRLLEELLLDIKRKFGLIESSELNEDEGWFTSWTFKTSDRADFIKKVNQFSSNNAKEYGRLLTPIVSGVRVKGRFKRENDKTFRNLVIFDGEGLGHTTETSTSLSNQITKKFREVDAILLVDNAAAPMLAAPTAAIQSMLNYGVETKLILAFTHFDQVKGDNFRNVQDRKNFVFSTIDNILAKIEKEREKVTRNELKKGIDNNTVFLHNLQEKEINKFTYGELEKLVGLIEKKAEKANYESGKISFDGVLLENHIVTAIREFHKKWDSYLGIFEHRDFKKRHWATLKAFTKRVYYFWQEEYGDLRPSADLAENLNQQMRLFIEKSIMESSKFDQETISWTIRKILVETSQKIQELVSETMITEYREEWINAYNYFGSGSSRLRAEKIKYIYNKTSLNPREDIPLMRSNKFVENVKKIMKEEIERNNCKLIY